VLKNLRAEANAIEAMREDYNAEDGKAMPGKMTINHKTSGTGGATNETGNLAI